MISLKKYLDSNPAGGSISDTVEPDEAILAAAIAAYGSALSEMGDCSLVACPGVGDELKQRLDELSAGLSSQISRAALAATAAEVRAELEAWGRRTSSHYRQKAGEVKEMLIVMARAAESVAVRDQRCAGQIQEVTSRLGEIASLDDLTEIRASIEKSAAALKISIERMTSEGKAALEQLRNQVSCCQARLQEAEEIASRDALTGVCTRLSIENQIETRIAAGFVFCVAMVDIDAFKKVNDKYGHVTGDELLKQFAGELRSASRMTDVIGRWGGDEFILLFDCGLDEAAAHRDRLRKWVCGSYTIADKSGPTRLSLNVSVGLAEHAPGESMKELLTRADADMYQHKGLWRPHGIGRQG